MADSKAQPGESVAICEACEREKREGDAGWEVGREGEDLCGDCADDFRGEVARKIAALPKRIALCPECAPEFYYPLAEGESPICPTPECGLTMAVYDR